MTMDKIQQIIEFAITKERETAAFYRESAELVQSFTGKELFFEMAEQEDEHQLKINNLDLEDLHFDLREDVPDLKIAENLPNLKISADMDYQQILTVAIKNEEYSHSLYNGLAKHNQDPLIKDLFIWLAREEAKHKLNLEELYEREIMTEN